MADKSVNGASADTNLLKNIKVIDFTRVLSGPYATRMMADLGAEVIKIERPRYGDEIRYIDLQLDKEREDQSSYFVRLNSGKKSVAIDLTTTAGREVVVELIKTADVVIENFSPGVMARLGLDWDTVKTYAPTVVYCSISGFGQTGPDRSRQAYANLVNAAAGMMEMERKDGARPQVAYLQTADVLAGAHAFGAICAALVRRALTHEGAYIDVSMLECMVAADDLTYHSILNGGTAQRVGRPGMSVISVGDGFIALQGDGPPHLWPTLIKIIGKPELMEESRFRTRLGREAHWNEIEAMIQEWATGIGVLEEVLQSFLNNKIPAAKMNSPEEVIRMEQLRHRGAFPEIPHKTRGTVRITATPFHVDGHPVKPAGAAPFEIGEHTEEIIRSVSPESKQFAS